MKEYGDGGGYGGSDARLAGSPSMLCGAVTMVFLDA